MSKIVTTSGYPRSGTTWVTRLLSDLLDSPIKTLAPDSATVIDFCQTGQGGYKVLKTHLRAGEWDGDGKVVFIQRDPRDVAVSALHYRAHLENTPENLMQVIRTMVTKKANPEFKVYHEMGAYENFVREWLRHPLAIGITYEDLSDRHNAMDELYQIGYQLTERPISAIEREKVIDRQHFDRHKTKYPHSMRKGIVGDWRNHFQRQHGRYITEHLGELMLEMGYIDDLDWWKSI